MPLEFNSEPTPRKIHFIWVGGPIYPEYLKSIRGLAQVAKRDGYEINLWVDDEQNYYKTAHKEDISVPNLRLRNIRDELFIRQNQAPFYKGNDPDFPLDPENETVNRAIKFQSYVERELVGFKNFAAAADLLRLEILRQEGGWYFDTDTYFPEINPPFYPHLMQSAFTPSEAINTFRDHYESYLDNIMVYNENHLPVFPQPPVDIRKLYRSPSIHNLSNEVYQNMFDKHKKCIIRATNSPMSTVQQNSSVHFDNSKILKLGIAINALGASRISRIGRKTTIQLNLDGSNNDILGAMKENYCIKKMILEALKNYMNMDARMGTTDLTYMDAKRYPNRLQKIASVFLRRDATINAAGPGVIIKVMDNIWKQAQSFIQEQSGCAQSEANQAIKTTFQSMLLLTEDGTLRAAGIVVHSTCDNTWLKNKNKLSPFTTNSLHSVNFKNQLKEQKRAKEKTSDIPPSLKGNEP